MIHTAKIKVLVPTYGGFDLSVINTVKFLFLFLFIFVTMLWLLTVSIGWRAAESIGSIYTIPVLWKFFFFAMTTSRFLIMNMTIRILLLLLLFCYVLLVGCIKVWVNIIIADLLVFSPLITLFRAITTFKPCSPRRNNNFGLGFYLIKMAWFAFGGRPWLRWGTDKSETATGFIGVSFRRFRVGEKYGALKRIPSAIHYPNK